MYIKASLRVLDYDLISAGNCVLPNYMQLLRQQALSYFISFHSFMTIFHVISALLSNTINDTDHNNRKCVKVVGQIISQNRSAK